MTQLEIKIKALEASLSTLDNTIALLGNNVPVAIQQQRQDIANELAQKRTQLAAQNQETVYEHLSRIVGYSPELKGTIEETVDKLLDNTISNADEPGLLLGKIQCGKTRTFVGCMALAFDRGIDVCVVMTKSDNGLVEQTRARMEYEFRDYQSSQNSNNPVIKVTLLDKAKSFTPYEINSQKHIFVFHKNTARLQALIKLFRTTDFKNKKVLIIDDEADFVSRTYYTKNSNVTIGEVGKKIGDFIHTCSYCRYLEVTATPYSLFLQPDETIQLSNGVADVFRPRFTTIVPIHKDYIGGKQYFYLSKNSASMYSYLYYDISQSCMDHLIIKPKQRIPYNSLLTAPVYTDLRYALFSYFVGSAIRQLQENGGQYYQTSFFMHVAIETKNHQLQERIVNGILTGWAGMIASGNLAYIPALFDSIYDDFYNSNKAGNTNGEISIALPNKIDVMNRVLEIFKQTQYSVQVINTGNKAQLGSDGQLVLTNPLNIFIGGFKLDRGITISHMIGFFYGRNPKTMQADSVLQHHRMYGNRSKEDMAVTRLYTTQSIYQNMEWIDNMDHELREIFVKASSRTTGGAPMVTIKYDSKKGIKPCGNSKIKLSNLESFSSFKRFTPFGQQTDCATAIKPIIDGIDLLLQNTQGYKVRQPFLLDKMHAYHIIKNIRCTYIYNRAIDNNAGMEWDEDLMIAAIEKYIPQDGKVWCYVATNRNMSRERQNGNFVDAPEDGNTDTPIASQFTQGPQSRPFLMLIRENGLKSHGWRDAPFYWPVLRLPQNIESCIYCK